MRPMKALARKSIASYFPPYHHIFLLRCQLCNDAFQYARHIVQTPGHTPYHNLPSIYIYIYIIGPHWKSQTIKCSSHSMNTHHGAPQVTTNLYRPNTLEKHQTDVDGPTAYTQVYTQVRFSITHIHSTSSRQLKHPILMYV